MIDGMRMDLVKSRYRNYDELYEYCYKVAGTVALMSVPVMGVDPTYKVRALTRRVLFGVFMVRGGRERPIPLPHLTLPRQRAHARTLMAPPP